MTTTTLLYATIDNVLAGGVYAANNYGAATTYYIGEAGTGTTPFRVVIKFAGLSDGTIPANAIIEAVRLKLYCVTDTSSNASVVQFFRLKRAWVEMQSTWNIWKTGSSWSTAGGFGADDCEQTGIGSKSLSAAETLNEYKTWTLTPSAIQEIVLGTWQDNGFLGKADTENENRYSYNTREAASNPPVLEVDWSENPVLSTIII